MISDAATGKSASVNEERQLSVISESRTIPGYISQFDGNAYQVWDTTTPANGTKTVLHIKNGDTDKQLVVTYIRLCFITGSGTAVPNTGTYFDIAVDRTVSSSGDTLTPSNMNAASGKSASVTATGNGPSMAGTADVVEQIYVPATGADIFRNKEGSLILGLNDTMEIRITHDNASGLAYARVAFQMENNLA
jgi:hypothetical protein